MLPSLAVSDGALVGGGPAIWQHSCTAIWTGAALRETAIGRLPGARRGSAPNRLLYQPGCAGVICSIW